MGPDRLRTALAVLAFMALRTTGGAFAQEPPSLPPVVTKDAWSIGVAVLNVGDDSPSMISASTLIPRLIKDELGGVDRHVLSFEERRAVALDILEERILEAYGRLENLHTARDAWLFDPNADPRDLKTRQQSIDEERKHLDFLESLSPGDLQVPETLPLAIPETRGGGGIWEASNGDFQSLRKQYGLDTLIAGSLVRVGEYYGIQIIAFGADGETILWEGAGGDAQLEEIAMEAGSSARRLALGRPWASLTVSVEPPDAVISANGAAIGVGYWSNSTLEPGDIILEITSPGHLPEIRRETLLSGDRRVLELALEPTDRPSALIRSMPTGADVRLGVLWLGRTPLSVELADRVMPLTLEKQGFLSRTVPLSPGTERLTVPLESRVVDPAVYLADTKKKLHNSIAWFSFSLAPTIVMMGVSQNYAGKFFASTSYEDQAVAYDAYYLTRGFMWAGVAVNTALLTTVLFRLSRYLKAAEGLSD